MWVLRRIQADSVAHDDMSPWRGCLWIDFENRKAWYATRQANPTIFATEQDAEEWKKTIQGQFPESEILVDVYEEVFQKPLPIPIPNNIVVTQPEVQGWNWNNDEPF